MDSIESCEQRWKKEIPLSIIIACVMGMLVALFGSIAMKTFSDTPLRLLFHSICEGLEDGLIFALTHAIAWFFRVELPRACKKKGL